MKIVVDALGSDHSPMNEIGGCIKILKDDDVDLDIDLVLAGDEDVIRAELAKYDYPKDRIEVIHASQVIGMDEKPQKALREKTDSSIIVGVNAVKEGRGQGFISCGNTGAVAVAALLGLGRIRGVRRPGIIATFPTLKGATLVIDAGSNPQCKPINLFQYGIMTSVYGKYFFDEEKPSVGLMSIGEEEEKGHHLVQETHKLLENSPLNYIGPVEGSDILTGKADIVVVDGFTGNVLLKFAESIPRMVITSLRTELTRKKKKKIGAWFSKPAFKTFRQTWDYAEYGGAPMLGVNGSVIIAHGKSNPKAIKNAILGSAYMIENNIVEEIGDEIAKVSGD
ncbi:MAG: phosphate acyltransferase PlsX [bacterium]|nr:phosphate acyltransferase PlsX [bacterium]